MRMARLIWRRCWAKGAEIMALTVTAATRVFNYSGTELPDPGPHMSPVQVRDLYSASFPELTSAEVEGPVRKGDKLVFEFRRAAGTKG